MKKLFILISVFITSIALAGCTPDENTADDIQAWYDACETIPTCAAKVDQMREAEFAESDIIISIQTELASNTSLLAEYGLTLLDHEQRISDLEAHNEGIRERNDAINRIVDGPSHTYTLLDNHNVVGTIGLSTNNEFEVLLLISMGDFMAAGYTAQQVEANLIPALLLDLEDVYRPEDIEINVYSVDADNVSSEYRITLLQLIARENEE